MVKFHVRESIRQVSVDNWIVANRISLVRTCQESPGCWSDGNGAFFATSEADGLEMETRGEHPFKKVYDAGDIHVVWQLGEAFLKIVELDSPGVTREHTTLEFLHKVKLDFSIPDVLFHGEWDGRYYLIVSKVPGETLNELWPTMNEIAKSRVVKKISTVCETLAIAVAGATMTRKPELLAGVDGQHLSESYLTASGSPTDFRPSTLLQNCHDMGIDCSALMFHHCDLGPTNILLDVVTDSLGIIDWECAGFVPKEWIMTKFRICGGMDLENYKTIEDPSSRHDYRRRVATQLGEDGFHDCATKWVEWRGLT